MPNEQLSLEDQLAELKKSVKQMKPKHYRLQSEYHRIMYTYALEIELINKALTIQNPDREMSKSEFKNQYK